MQHRPVAHLLRSACTIVMLLALLSPSGSGLAADRASTEANNAMVTMLDQRCYLPLISKPCIPTPLLLDDFSDPTSGWYAGDTTSYTMEYLNGEYRILVKPDAWVAYSWKDPGTSNFQLEVDARPAGVNLDGALGLIFSMTEHGFYLFEISDGSYELLRNDSDAWTWITLIPWTVSPALRTGAQSNRMRVDRSGSAITLYANGQLLATYNDGTYLGTDVGMLGESWAANYDARFDNFALYVPCGSQAVGTVMGQALPSRNSASMPGGLPRLP